MKVMGTTKKTLTRHFLHKHTLELSDDHLDCEYGNDCSVCTQPISDRQHYYRCSDCPEICIHDHSCSEIPPQIDHHPFHPHHTLFVSDQAHPTDYCDACSADCFGGFLYRCFVCHFVLDVKCALLIPTTDTKNNHQKKKKIQFQQLQQPNHPHPLISCDKDQNFSYTCCYCLLSIDGDWVYVCLQCKGLLHDSCAELPWEIEHPFHPSHPLVLSWPRSYFGQVFMCSLCCQRLHGFAYHCSKCEFVLDIHCACLKPIEDNQSGQIQQFRHSHTLILCNNLENFPFPCYACGLPIADSIYFCPECYVLLHKSCADLPEEVKHPLHPQHALTLRYYRDGFGDAPSWTCGACLRWSHGFFFECSQCEWYMDVRCAFLSKPNFLSRSRIHYHPLAFSTSANDVIRCNTCVKSCDTPFFRCVWCNFNHHVHCISALPPTLKYKYHVHPLTFTNCPIKDYPDEDDDAEFYCDACEERRDVARPTYYCEECHYVAHPHCVISEIIHILEEEWLKHEKAEEPPALTLKEFLDSFTEEENKEVQGLFEKYKRNVRGESGILPKILLSLYEDEDEYKNLDNEEVLMYSEELRRSAHLDKVTARIMKKFVSEVEVTMPWENWDSTSKVMKKFVFEVEVIMPWENWDSNWDSISKVIKDGNYMIFENQLSILKALFSKYGDFSESSRLSTNSIMLFIMTVCEAVHSMCSTKVADITTSLLLTWFHSFALAQEAGFEIEFVIARLTKLVRAHFRLQVDHAPVDPNLVNSEELAIIEQDGETNDLRKKVDAMRLTIIKLDEAIEELEKKKKALLKMREENECLIDALELQGQMAAGSILL